MNRSQVSEWLLDNDCPWDFDVVDSWWTPHSCTLVFSNKEEEDE